MRHRVHTFKIGRTGSHRRALLANMVSSLFEHGEITTTLVKAKEARIFVVHGHIALNGKKIDSPSYMVKRGEEEQIDFYASSPVAKQFQNKTAEEKD